MDLFCVILATNNVYSEAGVLYDHFYVYTATSEAY